VPFKDKTMTESSTLQSEQYPKNAMVVPNDDCRTDLGWIETYISAFCSFYIFLYASVLAQTRHIKTW